MNVRIDLSVNATVKEILVLCIVEKTTASIHMQYGCFKVEGTAASLFSCMSITILDKKVKGIAVANNKLYIQVD